MEWMILPLKRYADFRGRSRRKEFWMFQLFYYGVTIALLLVMFAGLPWGEMADGGLPKGGQPDFGILFWFGVILLMVWWLAAFIPSLAVGVRRLHDRGVSGWWYAGVLIGSMIPLVNLLAFPAYLVLLVFWCLDGTDGPNRWGPDPKDPNQARVFD